MTRLQALKTFYGLLSELERRLGGRRTLADANGRMPWPRWGVYFFFEPGEMRRDSGCGDRVVRVGTHALKHGSQTTLWNRLSQHKGTLSTGGGNHRGSIFRLLVGTALMARDPRLRIKTWAQGSSAPKEVREAELPLERAVSDIIRKMPFLWLEIDDEPGPESLRGFIERNAIGLLSNFSSPAPLDPPSSHWLGRYCPRERVRRSGLWNQNHVDEPWDPAFLRVMEELVLGT